MYVTGLNDTTHLCLMCSDYRPEYERLKKQKVAREVKEKAESLAKLQKDLAASGDGLEIKLTKGLHLFSH